MPDNVSASTKSTISSDEHERGQNNNEDNILENNKQSKCAMDTNIPNAIANIPNIPNIPNINISFCLNQVQTSSSAINMFCGLHHIKHNNKIYSSLHIHIQI